jgi:hypothetical protein
MVRGVLASWLSVIVTDPSGCGDLAARMAFRAVSCSVLPGLGVVCFSGEIGVGSVIDGFRRYRSAAPNIAEIAENKKRTN